mgnify:CR=1 FL=1
MDPPQTVYSRTVLYTTFMKGFVRMEAWAWQANQAAQQKAREEADVKKKFKETEARRRRELATTRGAQQ